MSDKVVIVPKALPPLPLPLSKAVRSGQFVFVAGIGGRNPKTSHWGDFEEQLHSSLGSIRIILEEAGTSLENVVSVTAYLKRRSDFDRFNDIFGQYFTSEFPARDC